MSTESLTFTPPQRNARYPTRRYSWSPCRTATGRAAEQLAEMPGAAVLGNGWTVLCLFYPGAQSSPSQGEIRAYVHAKPCTCPFAGALIPKSPKLETTEMSLTGGADQRRERGGRVERGPAVGRDGLRMRPAARLHCTRSAAERSRTREPRARVHASICRTNGRDKTRGEERRQSSGCPEL